ncbi:MAG TPA: FAD-binding oxidoreductase [Vicinamibacterales bacterium]|jgi:ferredoxin--NADP+ reductase|nr:FAD-binding oxidoreductase [Vicinamibacterales bacterium]
MATIESDTFTHATITTRVDISNDLWRILVDPGGQFPFAAGQYATLGASTAHGLVERAYSIVSSPHERELEFFFELVPDGQTTPLLHRLNAGDGLTIRRRAKGRFLLDRTSGRTNHLLLCTVTGIAPFVSYARTLKKEWDEGAFKGDHRLFLIQGASRVIEFGYQDEIERLAHAVPWLTYVPTISRPWDEPGWGGETGRVDDVIRKYTDRWSLDNQNTTAYLCGHPEMIAHGKAILHRHGWEKDALKEESYFVPTPVHA